MSEVLNEKCAVVGVSSSNQASYLAYEALLALQHRGTEAAGIAASSNGSFEIHQNRGMVKDVFSPAALQELVGDLAIGHVRYSTYGGKSGHLQPFEDRPLGFGFAHNGNLPVTDHMQKYLEKHNVRVPEFNDSEMMGLTIAQFLREGRELPDAVELSASYFRGSFSCTAIHGDTLVAFRDNRGIRPLAIGRTPENGVIIASETCGLDILGADYEREVEPGEMVIVSGDTYDSVQLSDPKPAFDMFELVYFSRPDSKFKGESIDQIRRRFGEQLAVQHPPSIGETEDILVVPVPDTSIPAAEAYANKLGLQYSQAIVKNRYSGRTFMDRSQGERQRSLSRKHAVIPEIVEGKNVVVIDDSIVRLNTMPRIVERLKADGAKTVEVLVSSPPVRFPDFYGIDTPAQSELIAANCTIEKIRQKIGCEKLGYLSLSRTVEATNHPYEEFNLSCFNGEYPISIGARMKEVRDPVSKDHLD